MKLVRFPQDIFELDYKKIENLDGWGKLSAANLKHAIDSSKKITLDKLIFSLGIRHIGQENSKLIAENVKTLENFTNISSDYNFNSFLNIDGIGETQIKSFEKFFSNKTNLRVIQRLKKYISIVKIDKNISGKFKNKTFMFTGKLEGISRAEAKSIIEKNSGKMLSTVNNKLNYLIIGHKPTTRKVKLAKELDINVISQKDWQKMLN